MILSLAIAFAGEMDAVPPVVVVARAPIPDGPPVEVVVAPGESVQAAVASVPPGSTVVLRAGRHPGPVVVDRPLTLRGEPGAVLDGGGTGSVLMVVADDVVVRDLHVTGGGHLPQQDDSGVVVGGDRVRVERVRVTRAYLGIDLRQADDGVVRDCVVEGDPGSAFGLRGDGIRLWESDRNVIERNRLSDVRDLVVWYSDGNTFADNQVTRSRYGTHLMHTFGNRVSGNTYDHDVVGVFVMYSDQVTLERNVVTGAHGEAGVGFGFKESDAVTCVDNVLVDDTTGIYLDTTPHRAEVEATFRGNLIAANDFGVRFHGPSAGARFTQNAFVSNRVPAASDERGRPTNAVFERNHWSGYEGYDLDRDGVGDLPFEVRTASGKLRDRTPALAFMTGTPAMALVDLFVAAFPMFAPEPVLVDPRPLVLPPPPPEVAVIAVEHLWKAYGQRPVLHGLSFQLAAGERMALVGPNGSGKTTLLRCLLGLVQGEGSVRIGGRDPFREHAEAQRRVAYVPQRAPALAVPVGELVTFWAAQRGLPKERLLAATEALGLDVALHWQQLFPALSGGMQQKLLAAMALASECEVMLLDEPTANLDPPARAVFFEVLARRDPAPTVVLSSHRLEELRRLVDRVLVLRDGRIAFDDRLDSFLADPALAAAAGLELAPTPAGSVVPLRRSP